MYLTVLLLVHLGLDRVINGSLSNRLRRGGALREEGRGGETGERRGGYASANMASCTYPTCSYEKPLIKELLKVSVKPAMTDPGLM